MAIEREKSPTERGATLQGFNGREVPPEAAEKILDVLDKTVDQFLAAKQAQRLEKDLPTRVLEDGTKEWRNEAGLFHREKGPAIEFSDGRLLYFQNGALHRSDGPAVINTDGSRLYFLNDKQVQEREIMPARTRDNGVKEWHNEKGELHREYGPAIERPNGTQEWYQNGARHREDGPAIERANGEREWYQNGVLHREGGAAVRDASHIAWYRNGVLHNENWPAVVRSDGTMEYYQNGLLHREDGPAIVREYGTGEFYLKGQHVTRREVLPAVVRNNGTKEWHNEQGQLHREHGPAFTHPDGTEAWYRHGDRHRDNGPAVIDGITKEQKWYCEGKLHRENGPAIVYEDGAREYYQKGLLHREDGPARVEITDNVAVSYAEYRIRGELHREDGPAIERDTGEKEYYRHGKLHREDGPAIERPDGTKEYYLNGEKTTAAEICKSLGISSIAQMESRTPETLEKAAAEDLRIAKATFPQHFQSEKDKECLENARKTNEFMDRPLPPGNGAAREYCVEARKAIALNGQWPGKSADENIAKKLLQQGHDKSKIIEAIQGKSPEVLGKEFMTARAYAKALVDRALTPEIKKERQRSLSRVR